MAQAFARVVKGIARRTIAEAISDPGFRDLVAGHLARRPYVLSENGGDLRAAALVMGAFQAGGGTGTVGARVAAAMEMFHTALHLLDGLSDDDSESSSADVQVAAALQLTMSYLLERTRVNSLGGNIDWGPIYSMLTSVGSGQQRDIDFQRLAHPTLEDAKAMTFQKTGSFGETLMTAGCLAAGASADLLKELALLGQFIGMSGQVADDALDASPAKPETSDIRLRKKTIPIVFFLDRAGDSGAHDRLRGIYMSAGALKAEEEMEIRRAIEDCGGIQMASALATWYKIKALEALGRLRSKGCKTRFLDEHLGVTALPRIARAGSAKA